MFSICCDIAGSQGGASLPRDIAIHQLLHAWAHRRPWLAGIVVIDRADKVCPSHQKTPQPTDSFALRNIIKTGTHNLSCLLYIVADLVAGTVDEQRDPSPYASKKKKIQLSLVDICIKHAICSFANNVLSIPALVVSPSCSVHLYSESLHRLLHI